MAVRFSHGVQILGPFPFDPARRVLPLEKCRYKYGEGKGPWDGRGHVGCVSGCAGGMQ